MGEVGRVSRRAMLMGSCAFVFALGRPIKAHAAGAKADARVRLPVPDHAPADGFFGRPYIDVDEWREWPERFRYVHGGFENTDTRFSFYFPNSDRYRSRFYQVLAGGSGGYETGVLDALKHYDGIGVTPPRSLMNAFELGGYLVESNQGHLGEDLSGSKGDPTIISYRASAETARFGRVLAREMYGAVPQFGYIYGGSGGAVRSINCLEYVKGIWHGAVPIVSPTQSSGIFFSQLANAVRLLSAEDKRRLDDAVNVGGSGEPFAGLDDRQAEALRVLYRTGFPRDMGLSDPSEMVYVWMLNQDMISRQDPGYWSDFWNKPGYAGHDEDEPKADRIRLKGKITKILSAAELADYGHGSTIVDERGTGQAARQFRGDPKRPYAIVLDGGRELLPRLGCSGIIFQSGAAKGRECFVVGVVDDALILGGLSNELLQGVQLGDDVLIDNSQFISFCFFYRYQVDPELREWNTVIRNGTPLYEQRTRIRPSVSIFPYTWQTGDRKMIFVSSMQDRGVFRTAIAANIEQLKRVRGAQFVRDSTRVWLNDHAHHGGVTEPDPMRPLPAGQAALNTRLIDYQGAVLRALKAVTLWVEEGKKPLPDTAYDYTQDCNLLLPASAVDRKGIQPVVALTGNGQTARLVVTQGEAVKLVATAECPPGSGILSVVEWDIDGSGQFSDKKDIRTRAASSATFTKQHVFDKPGTYFLTVRVTSIPDLSKSSDIYALPNIGRLRVIVN